MVIIKIIQINYSYILNATFEGKIIKKKFNKFSIKYNKIK